jgi:hypothetical protein
VLLLLVTAGCGREEPAASAKKAPTAPSASSSSSAEKSVPQAAATPAAVNPGDAFVVSPNPELKGRLGRLVISFPEGADVGGTRVDVYKSGESKSIAGGYGSRTFDLLPGTHAVAIAGKLVEGVPVQSGNDTKLKVGAIRITAGSGTRVDLLDPATKKSLSGGYGNKQYGLPIGTIAVQVANQSELVTIQEGKITDF